MSNISAVVITRNEKDVLLGCLNSLIFCKEIIVIDNKSSDETAAIAKKAGARVFSIPGLDFSYLRNYGKEKAQEEWLLYIDADERVTDVLKDEILHKTAHPHADSYLVERKNYYFGRPWPYSDQMTRLMKKSSLIGWLGALHETPHVVGKIGSLKNPLLHYSHDDLTQMVDKTNEWSEIEAQLRYQNGHPPVVWWRFLRVSLTAFFNSYIRQNGWKAGTMGMVESTYQAFSMFITYAKLWEKQNRTLVKKTP